MKYIVGDIVYWRSQSSGYLKDKSGVVTAIVPAHGNADEYLPHGFTPLGTSGYGSPRDHESYLVRVGSSTRLYWPKVTNLSRLPLKLAPIPDITYCPHCGKDINKYR